jgi:hypothetical protein
VVRGVSQPSVGLLLQSPKSVAHTHWPLEHTVLAGQALPQAPQLACRGDQCTHRRSTSESKPMCVSSIVVLCIEPYASLTVVVRRSTSQPSVRSLLQSPKLVVHLHSAPEHAEFTGQTLPQAPQLVCKEV